MLALLSCVYDESLFTLQNMTYLEEQELLVFEKKIVFLFVDY